jgi:hypothetical protein
MASPTFIGHRRGTPGRIPQPVKTTVAENVPPSSNLIRTTLHLPTALRIALKRLAVDLDTTMGALIRNAITTSLQDTKALAAESLRHRRTHHEVRTTVDLPARTHRVLKIIAINAETSVQALLLASIHTTYPQLKTG